MYLDIRDLIQLELSKHEDTWIETSKVIYNARATLHNVIQGTSSLSPKAFLALVHLWCIHKQPPLLQAWLTAYLVDKLGLEAIPLVKKAGWQTSAVDSQAILDNRARVKEEQYTAAKIAQQPTLAKDKAAHNRRLKILELISSSDKPIGIAIIAGGVRDSAHVVSHDLRRLAGIGLIIRSKCKTVRNTQSIHQKLAHFPPNVANVYWDITKRGKALLTKLTAMAVGAS